jgi:Flp pilus assembly protein CpaB
MRLNPLTVLIRKLTIHRRLVAVIAAMACVWSLTTILNGRHLSQVTVTVTNHRVEAGRSLTAADLTERMVPAELVPEGALSLADSLERMTATALPTGAIVTADAVVTHGNRASASDRLIVPVRLTPADLATLLQPGDRIALLITDAASGQTELADDVLVTLIPSPDSGGLLSGSSAPDYILVDVTAATAKLLAGAAVRATITLALV